MLSAHMLRQIFAFGCVGVFATVVHYGVALLFTENAWINIYFANIAGYLCAVLVSLYGHSIFTYKKKVDRVVVRRFVVVSLSTLACSEGILYLLEALLMVDYRIALAVVVTSIPVVSFFLNKFWVYASSSE